MAPDPYLSALSPQYRVLLVPTSVVSQASACLVCREPTRTWKASSAARHAPAAKDWVWLVPATYPNVEASVAHLEGGVWVGISSGQGPSAPHKAL